MRMDGKPKGIENIYRKYEFTIIFTSFDQNTVKFYDNHIFITMICIFWPKFVLKPRYVSLRVKENGKVFQTLFPLSYIIIMISCPTNLSIISAK